MKVKKLKVRKETIKTLETRVLEKMLIIMNKNVSVLLDELVERKDFVFLATQYGKIAGLKKSKLEKIQMNPVDFLDLAAETKKEILPVDEVSVGSYGKSVPVVLSDEEVQTVLNTPGRMVVDHKEDFDDEDCDSPGRLLEKAVEEFGIYQDKLLIPLDNGTRLSIAYKFYGALPKEYDDNIKKRCFVYDTWRKSITNTISCVSTAYPGDIITRFSQIEEMVRYSKYKESINEYGFYLRVIRSAIILYQCFGIDNIYDNSLREDFIRSMNDLEFYFTTMSDLVKYNRTVLTRIHAFTFRFIPKDKCGYKFGLRYTPTRRATSSCLDSYIGDNTRFSDKKIADYEDALTHNFPDIEEYDQYVLYSFSVFNTSECNEYVGVDNSIITPERTKKFQKLNSVIIKIYRYYLDKVLGVYDMEDIDYNEVVKNDKFLKENLISLVNDDFNK